MREKDLEINKSYAVEIYDNLYPIIIEAVIIQINVDESQYNFNSTNNYISRNDGILVKSLDSSTKHLLYKVYPENIIYPYHIYKLLNR